MSTAEAPSHTPGLGLVWRVIPALWLVVGLGGMSALSYQPQWFAEPLQTERSANPAECPTLVAASGTNTGLDTAPDAYVISTSLNVLHSPSERGACAGLSNQTNVH